MSMLRAIVLTVMVGGLLAVPSAVAARNGTSSAARVSVAADPPIPVDADEWTFFSWFSDGGLDLEGRSPSLARAPLPSR